jgi:hypothetical protein
MGAQKNVAVELFFDSTSERRLRELWASLEAIYGDDHESELGVRPHLSLTVFPGGEPEFLKAELQSLASRFVPFCLKLNSVESFPTSEGVVYLAPFLSEPLEEIHATFHESLAIHQVLGHAYYRPGSWVPHCSVATGVPPNLRDAVLGACGAADALGEVWVRGVAATAYRPRLARELVQFPLHPEKSVGM